MKCIVSAVPGRLRIKVPQLLQGELAQRFVECSARALPLLSSRANPDAFSIVLHYDADAISLSDARTRVEQTLDALLAPAAKPGKSMARRRSARLRLNRYAKMGALASLAVSLASAYAGPKRLHVMTGWVFVACLCAHLAVFRRTLTH